jgi:hypothetical protein
MVVIISMSGPTGPLAPPKLRGAPTLSFDTSNLVITLVQVVCKSALRNILKVAKCNEINIGRFACFFDSGITFIDDNTVTVDRGLNADYSPEP